MQEFPKVTIIIATYNAVSCIENALKSVCALSYDAWECVIVDGLSKDGTMDIVRQYAEKEKRIRYVSEPDKGIYDAFNKGWKMAKGEYVYYLGADDVLYPNSLTECFANSPQADIIYGHVDYTYGKETFSYYEKNVPKRLLKSHLCSHQAMVMRRESIKMLNGFDMQYRICADFDLIQRAYLKGCSFEYVKTNFGIHDICGASCGFENEKDGYRIRRNNHSVSTLTNLVFTAYTFYMRLRSKIIFSIKKKIGK